MCRYKSAVVLPNGDLVHSDVTDSHEDLLAVAGLTDQSRQPAFVRVEYTGSDLADITTYELRVDQDFLPPWWTTELAEDVTRRLRGLCERAIVREHRQILLGGVWVLAGAATVGRVVSARVIAVRDSATIGEVWGSATIGEVGGSATIGAVWGSATIGAVLDSATIEAVRGSATIKEVRDSATIGEVGPHAVLPASWRERLEKGR